MTGHPEIHPDPERGHDMDPRDTEGRGRHNLAHPDKVASHPHGDSRNDATASLAVPAPRQPADGSSAGEGDPWWRHHAWRVLLDLAATGRPFSADDLRDRGVGEPDRPNCWGRLFADAAGAGLIRATGGLAVSRRRSRAAGVAREWRGAQRAQGAA